MVGLPLLGVSICALAMAFNPLKRGTHERIVAELSAGGGTPRLRSA